MNRTTHGDSDMTTLRKLTPARLTDVEITDAFWAPRLDVNRNATLPIQYDQCKTTGRLDAMTWKKGKGPTPHIFWDSDTAKWIEAAAYSLATHPDRKLQRKVDRVIDAFADAQCEDGYLNSYFTQVEPDKRWSNIRDRHELYCAGHLMEAAVAYYEATGKRKLLDVMSRYADTIDTVFGPRTGQRRGYPGHEEIELALVKLYNATGQKRYLDLSKFFIDERGAQPHFFHAEAVARGDDPKRFHFHTYQYCQSHLPVREQREVVGHAVRACYLYAGMADVAGATGDRTLLAACKRLWKNVTERRMHVHGGIGPTSRNEGFTLDYDLPNETAYAETCAAIALVFFAHRMLQVEPDSKYADVMERALYNNVLAGVSHDGKAFFYGNPLSAYPGYSPHSEYEDERGHYRRSEWFGCACCPPNLARLLASLGQYVYSSARNAAWVHLYAGGQASLDIGKQKVTLQQKTHYPWDGCVKITVRPDVPAEFTLALRIPGWSRGAKLTVNGHGVALADVTIKGYAKIKRLWSKGDRVELTLPMPVERIEAHPKVRQDRGCVALQRGPVLYCLEQVDNGPDLRGIVLPRDARLTARKDAKLFGQVSVITGKARRFDAGKWTGGLYRPVASKTRPASIKAIPYFLWANRAKGEMLVWLREQ